MPELSSDVLSTAALDHVTFACRLGARHEKEIRDPKGLFLMLVAIMAHYDNDVAAVCLASLEAILEKTALRAGEAT